jgi:hypothetical protein
MGAITSPIIPTIAPILVHSGWSMNRLVERLHALALFGTGIGSVVGSAGCAPRGGGRIHGALLGSGPDGWFKVPCPLQTLVMTCVFKHTGGGVARLSRTHGPPSERCPPEHHIPIIRSHRAATIHSKG